MSEGNQAGNGPEASGEAPASGAGKTTSGNDERMWCMLTHLSALAGFLVPLGNILGPLIVWQIKKNEMPAIESHGKEALNFQISMAIYFVISFVLVFVGIGLILMPAVAIVDVVFTIIAGLKANEGVEYKYPLTIRMVK